MNLFWTLATIVASVAASVNIGTTRTFPIKALDSSGTSNSQKFRRSISPLDPETLVSVQELMFSNSGDPKLRFLGAHAVGADTATTDGSTSLVTRHPWKELSRHVSKRNSDSGSLSSTTEISYYNSSSSSAISYYVEIKLGTFNDSADEKVYNVLIDTGSFFTWVHSANCTTAECSEHTLFDAEQSTTSSFTGLPFYVIYTTGLINGTFIQDRVRLAGFDFGNQYFGLVTSGQSSFSSYAVDGILGLPSKDPDSSTRGILNTLYEESLISQRIIGISLGGDEGNTTDNNEGSLSIGGVDSEKYSGEIEYYSIDNSSVFWEIPVSGTFANGTEISFASGTSDNGTRTAIVDTGTTLLLMPPNDALKIHSYIENSITDGSNYVIPCNATIEFAFSFGTNGTLARNWSVGPYAYIGEQYNDDGLCLSNIQGLSVDGNQWVLGDVFLRGIYSVFDMDNAAVGFATKKASNTSVTPESTFVSLSSNSTSEASSSVSSSASATTTTKATSGASRVYMGVYTLALSFILQFLL